LLKSDNGEEESRKGKGANVLESYDCTKKGGGGGGAGWDTNSNYTIKKMEKKRYRGDRSFVVLRCG